MRLHDMAPSLPRSLGTAVMLVAGSAALAACGGGSSEAPQSREDMLSDTLQEEVAANTDQLLSDTPSISVKDDGELLLAKSSDDMVSLGTLDAAHTESLGDIIQGLPDENGMFTVGIIFKNVDELPGDDCYQVELDPILFPVQGAHLDTAMCNDVWDMIEGSGLLEEAQSL